MQNYKKGSSIIIACAFVISTIAAFAASDTLYNYTVSSLELAAGMVPNKLTLSAYQEVTYRDNEHSKPRSKREDNVGYEAGIDFTFVRSKAWLTYGVDCDVSYTVWHLDSSDDDGVDWNVSPTLTFSIEKENTLIQNLHVSLSSTSQFDKISKTEHERARHVDNQLNVAYDMKQHGRFGNVITFDYTYDYYTQRKYRNRSYQEWEIGLAPYYQFSGKLKGGLHLAYLETTYKKYKGLRNQSDSDEQDILAFVDYNPTDKLNFNCEVGVSRTRYKGEGKHSDGSNDWEPSLDLRITYKASSIWSFKYDLDMSFDDSDVSTKFGGSYQVDNSVSATWKPSSKFEITNKIGVEVEDEKDHCKDDTAEYYYNVNASYSFHPKFKCYADYDFSNVRYKYKGHESYYESEVTLGVKYTF